MQLTRRLRSRPAETLQKAARLVDEETGVIKLLHEPPIAPDGPRIFGCGSLCSDYSQFGHPSESFISGSTSLDRDQAIAGAIGEAVERYSAASVPHERLAFGPSEAMGPDAVMPASLTLYDDAQYAVPGFGYHPVDASTPIGWAVGHSLTRRRPVLVPAFADYQPYRSEAGEQPVIQQVTTGLACGNTLEEAILSAICEVVERDAAISMWLQRRQPRRVVMDPTSEGPAAETLRRFRGGGSHVELLEVTTGIGIPAYVAAWRGPVGGRPGAVFASCAKPSAQRAAAGALAELAQCLMWAASLQEAGQTLPDPATDPMSRIEDHVLWPLREDAEPAYGFVFSSTDRVGLDACSETGDEDVLSCIEACVALLAAQGLETVVVDVTSPDIEECGLHVVRAVIPGAQPLFFGAGLQRLSTRGRRGIPHGTLPNLHPHPFP